MIDDIPFSDTSREEVARLAEACLLAGHGDRIPELIRKGATLDDCRRMFAADDAGNARAILRSRVPSASGPSLPSAPSWSDVRATNAERLAAYQQRH